MLRRVAAAVVFVSLASPAFAQQTHTGRVEPNFINLYSFSPGAPGQLLATLSWDAAAANLLLLLVCTVDGEEIAYGVASGMLDRFARLEAGVLPVPCQLGILTASVSASYTLNLQLSQPQPATPQPRTALPMGMSARIVIPGTPRGTVIERLAFRLQFAVDRIAVRR